jgi:hypothetical protein
MTHQTGTGYQFPPADSRRPADGVQFEICWPPRICWKSKPSAGDICGDRLSISRDPSAGTGYLFPGTRLSVSSFAGTGQVSYFPATFREKAAYQAYFNPAAETGDLTQIFPLPSRDRYQFHSLFDYGRRSRFKIVGDGECP